MIIFNLPEIPRTKEFIGQDNEARTPEQIAIHKCIEGKKLEMDDEKVLQETISFYETAFNELKNIDLSKISDGEVIELTAYLDSLIMLEAFVKISEIS